jgi:predicted nucleotidyltransferase
MSPENDLPCLLNNFRAALEAVYGDRLQGLYLYGSFARGDYDSESDIDLLVVLDDFSSYGQEVERTDDLASRCSLEWGASISLVFVRHRDWLSGDSLFLRTVREEAVSA